jgi:hypothetical protein
MNKILHKIVTVFLALLVFAATLFFESGVSHEAAQLKKNELMLVPSEGGVQVMHGSASNLVSTPQEFLVGDVIDVPVGQTAVLHFSDNGLIRLGPGSKFQVIGQDFENGGFIVELGKGRAWINSNFTSANLNILAGSALLIPRRAALDVAFDGSKTVVRAAVNQVAVGLIKSDYAPDKLIRFKNDSFINSFLVAQGSQTTIYLDKVRLDAEILKKLLYSKLIKEFQYGLFDKKEAADDLWYSQNMKEDADFAAVVASDQLKAINSRGLKIAGLDSLAYGFQKAIDGFANTFTFSGSKVRERLLDSIFVHVDDAEYLFTYGRAPEAKERLSVFKQLVTETAAQQDQNFKSVLLDRLRQRFVELNFVLPDDPLFEAKAALSDALSAQLGDSDDDLIEKFTLIRDYMNNVYRLAESNTLLARLTLEQYFQRFQDFVKNQKGRLSGIKNLIAEENQVFDNLLRQFSQFYQDNFFAMKHTVENEWLALLPEGDGKNEEKQTIISTKIDFLKQLQAFFLDEKVSLKEAKLIAFRLINEIKDLQTGTQIGVSELFNLRLKDYGQFLRFLNTADLGSLSGISMRDKYQDFLKRQQEQVSVDEAIKEFLGNEAGVDAVPVVTPQQILDQMKTDFEKIDVTELQVGEFTSLDQRYIYVKHGVFKNVTFQAQYDWDRKLLSDIRVGTEVVSKEPIRLENLGQILVPPEQIQPTPAPAPAGTTQEVTESKADRVAKILLIQKLKSNDIAAVSSNIEIKDASAGLFVVQNASIISDPKVKIAFGFNNKTNKAFVAVVGTVSGQQSLEGEIDIADLAAIAREAFDAAQQQALNQ